MSVNTLSKTQSSHARRFGGIDRLYGPDTVLRLSTARVAVVGLGGVGSWAAEALARSGIGHLLLADLDHIAESNINRQIHALESTLGQAKVTAMAARLTDIHPELAIRQVDDFITPDNIAQHLTPFGPMLMIDATDAVAAKKAMAVYALRQGFPLLMAGSAGGKKDPGRLRCADLSESIQDPLLARVRTLLRQKIRREGGMPKPRLGVRVVYSDEALQRSADCDPLAGLACAGYGSSVMLTASMGFHLAAEAVRCILAMPFASSPPADKV
jgi:tRNA threonylcarbamoyladenosine dehydratase